MANIMDLWAYQQMMQPGSAPGGIPTPDQIPPRNGPVPPPAGFMAHAGRRAFGPGPGTPPTGNFEPVDPATIPQNEMERANAITGAAAAGGAPPGPPMNIMPPGGIPTAPGPQSAAPAAPASGSVGIGEGINNNYMSLLQAGMGMMSGQNMRQGWAGAMQGLQAGAQADRARRLDTKKDKEEAEKKRQELEYAKGLADYVRKSIPGEEGARIATQILATPQHAQSYAKMIIDDNRQKAEAAALAADREAKNRRGDATLKLQQDEHVYRQGRDAGEVDREVTKTNAVEGARSAARIKENEAKAASELKQREETAAKLGFAPGSVGHIEMIANGRVDEAVKASNSSLATAAERQGLGRTPPAGYQFALKKDGQTVEVVPLPKEVRDSMAADRRASTEHGSKAANMLGIAEQAEKSLGVSGTQPGASLWNSIITGYDPAQRSGLNDSLYSNTEAGKAALKYRDTAAAFLGAKLRFESGATITEVEFKRDYPIFFPVPGDDAENIKRKAELRQTVLQGMRHAAGQSTKAGPVQGKTSSGADFSYEEVPE